MLIRIIEFFRRLFGIKPRTTETEVARNTLFVNRYEEIDEINLTALISSRLANIICADCSIGVIGEMRETDGVPQALENPRSIFLDESIERPVAELKRITARALGTGGVVLKPWVYNGKLYTDVINQDKLIINAQQGGIITSAGIVADVVIIDDVEYVRMENHTLHEGGMYTIEQKALRDGNDISLTTVPEWANLPPVQTIQGVEQMLFAVLPCPTDNRKDSDSLYGVPVTFGQDKLISEIVDLLNKFYLEFVNKTAFIGADSLLFRKDEKTGNEILPDEGLYKIFRALGGLDKGTPFFEVFSPDIREQSYINGINYKMGLLEKAIGVNKGILTDMETADATATAIKRGSLDTFSLVDSMRKNIETAFGQLLYAFDILANAGNLAPQGKYSAEYDWDYSLLESSTERWNQLLQGQGAGVVRPEELRVFLFDETASEAIGNLPESDELLRE